MQAEVRFLNAAICWMIALSFFFSSCAWAVSETTVAVAAAGQAASSGGTPPDDLESIYERFAEVRGALDRSQFDQSELVFSLDFDPDAIGDFVAREIRFQQYSGLLRAAEGTLVSRAGNALDQSVLLARLLKDAGYEARINRGRLAREDASRLLSGMFGEMDWPEPFGERNRTLAERISGPFLIGPRDEAVRELSAQIAAENEQIAGRIERVGDRLQRQTAELLERVPSTEALVDEALDYFWVDYRLGPGDPWASLHPAFGDADAPVVEATGTLADSVPARLQHRIRIELMIRSEIAGRETTQALMTAWERPAANAAYTPLSIGFLPHAAGSERPAELIEAGLTSAELFLPYFNGSPAPGAMAFTLDGRVLPPEAMSSTGEFVKTVSDQGIRAVSALGELGASASEEPPDSVAALNELWVQYTLIAPGGAERTIRRSIVGPEAGSAADREADLRLSLLQSRNLVLATGQQNPTWLLDRIAETAESGRDTLETVRQRVQDPSIETRDLFQGLDPLPESQWLEYLLTTLTDTGVSATRASYLHEPMLISFDRGLFRSGEAIAGFEQVDIVANARRSLSRQDGRVTVRPDVSMAHGIYESLQEHQLLERDAIGTVSSAFERLEGVEDFTLIEAGSAAGTDLDAELRRLVDRELEAGYAVLIPDDDPASGWWRVDADTGTATAMGIGPGGYGGQSAAEYIQILGAVISAMFMYYNFYKCFQSYSGLELFCCLMASWILGVAMALVMYVMAQIIGAVLGSAALNYSMVHGSGLVATESVRATAALLNLAYTGVATKLFDFSNLKERACGLDGG